MQARLTARLGLEPQALDEVSTASDSSSDGEERQHRKKPFLSVGRVSLAKLRYEPPVFSEDDISEARIRAAFRDLAPEDIRRYIGVRGEDYLYYRQNFPGWEPIFAFVALVLRGIKRLETFASQYN
jgi:hypothetical protein